RLPSTGSRPPSGHPLPALERAARLLARIELLPTPERGRMARQNAPNMVRMGSPDGAVMGLPTGNQVAMFDEAPPLAGVGCPFPTRRAAPYSRCPGRCAQAYARAAA